MENWDRIREQVLLMKRLCRQSVGEAWALQAIKDAAGEICRLLPDDLASDYATEIRIAAAGDQFVPQSMIADSLVGERIERLAQYCEHALGGDIPAAVLGAR